MSLTKADHTSFSNAIQRGDFSVVQGLLRRHPELVNHPNWTPPPLHCAIYWNQPKIAEVLLDCGADIEMLDPDRQTTPLRYAIMYCKAGLFPLLLDRGANVGPIIEGGTSALQLAKEAAAGAYEEYGDLPTREAYEEVVVELQEAGLSEMPKT